MHDPELEPEEKAAKMAALAGEIGPRVSSARSASAAAKALLDRSTEMPEPIGETKAAAEEFEVERGTFAVFKDRDGEYRWLGLHSNNYRDKDGQWFSADAHKEYADWAMSEEGILPTLRLWHVPVDVGDADHVSFDGNFMLSSGTFRKEWYGLAEELKAAEGSDLGMSHGFQYRPQDLRDGVYHKYRSFEVSVLPREAAANEFTAYFAKDMPMLNENVRAFLAEKGGEDLVRAAETTTDALKSAATEAGVDYKSVVDHIFKDDSTAVAEPPEAEATETPKAEATEEQPEATEATEQPEAEATETPKAEATEEQPEGEKALTLDAIKSAMEAVVAPIAAEVEELKRERKSDDERIAEMLRPKSTGHRAAFSASREGEEVPANVAEQMKVEETEEKAQGEASWVSPYTDMLKVHA
jgi:hypothetical protein